jgi:hypothetical protein
LAVLPRVVAAVAVAVLSACTSQVGGAPVAGTTVPEEPEELTAESVFEDPTTIAPCSLVDPSVLESFGGAELGQPESLDYCAISVDPPDGTDVLIAVGELGVLDAAPEVRSQRVKEVDGGLWVGQQDNIPSYCSQLLVFPDEVTMKVEGIARDGGDADTCPMVEAAMDHAVEVILDGGVEHREPEDNSLVTLDPCSLVSDGEIGAIPGLSGARRPNPFPGKHICFWEAGPQVTVRLQFGAGAPPAPHGPGANQDPLAGRPTVMNLFEELGEYSYCSVESAHIPFEEVEGTTGAVEVANVFVRMPKGQVVEGCVAVRTVAGLVWPKLPKV